MGLLSTEVEVLLRNNVKWFEDKGYKIPRTLKKYKTNKRYTVDKGTKIKVKVEDLPKGSHVKVDCECDKCHKPLKIEWCNYITHNHNNKTYCHRCATKLFNSGENCCRWNPNKTDEERINGRQNPKYIEFVQKVLARDNYTCVITGKTSKDTELEVHHLDGYDWYIDGRTDVKNGITITKELHKAFHMKYGYGLNTKKQFLEFVGMIDIILEDYNGEIPTSRWAYCITDNELIKNVNQYAKNNNVCATHIYGCCNGKQYKANGKIYIWYDIYIKMSEEEIKMHINECESKGVKKIVCENYKLLFENAKCAGIYFNISSSCIIRCCSGKGNYGGKTADGEKLIWKYAKDIDCTENYTFISKEECEKALLSRNQESSNDGSFIM